MESKEVKQTRTITMPLSIVGKGNFFYKRNKRYVLLDINDKGKYEAINTKGNIVTMGNDFVTVYAVNYEDDKIIRRPK